MEFTFKIENYYPYENRLFVLYTPIDVLLEPMGGWVYITASMTESEIQDAVVAAAPIDRWGVTKNVFAGNMVGYTNTGVKVQGAPSEIPEPTIAELAAEFQRSVVCSVQNRLDSFAATKNYDGILSACSYTTSAVPKFAAEALYCSSVRDATWAALYQGLAEVEVGTRPMPSTYAEVELLLPPLEWPL